jgi:hypothetical protein
MAGNANSGRHLARAGTKAAIFRSAVAEYLDCGNLQEVSRRIGVGYATVYKWHKRPDWTEYATELKACYEAKHIAAFRKLAERGAELSLERLENGDETVLAGGLIVTTKVKARDAAVIASIGFDKMRLAQGRPKGISEQTEGLAAALLKQFQKLGQQYKRGEVIEAEVIPKSEGQTQAVPVQVQDQSKSSDQDQDQGKG